MKPQVIATAARIGNALESIVTAVRRGRPSRAPRELRVFGYRSHGCAAALTVQGRVVFGADTTERELRRGARPGYAHLLLVYRAFDVVDAAGAAVEADYRGVRVSGVADEGGYFELTLRAGAAAWPAGWHEVPITSVVDGQVAGVIAEVYVPSEVASLLVVSDLDDTAMDTETMRSLSMLRTVLFRAAERRRAVQGVPELYRALHAGRDDVRNPVCYISSGAWNLYEPVREYLDTHGLPRGAILLNDWGSRERRFRTVAHTHKSTHVLSLMRRYPQMPLLLIGDDTQEDPELYSAIAQQHPDPVAAIWIRRVRADAARHRAVEALAERVRASGVPVVYASETDVFAAHAQECGWIG